MRLPLVLLALACFVVPSVDSFSARVPSSSTTAVTTSSSKKSTDDGDKDSATSPSSSKFPLQEKFQCITCGSTNELAEAVTKFVRPGDAVAELGSQLRDVSTAICDTLDGSGSAVLVDVVRKFPKNTKAEHRIRAMRRPGDDASFYPEIATFVEIPQLDAWRSAFLDSACGTEAPPSFDVLVLDVNAIVGNDLEWTALSIYREFKAIFASCRVVLIKSVTLNQWAARLVHGQRWIDKAGIRNDMHSPHVIATVGVQEYRKTIPFTVKPGDSVLEVGCHFGTSTIVLNEAAVKGDDDDNTNGYCIGVDVGPKIIKGAKRRYPDVFFAVGDAWRTASLLRIQQECNMLQGRESTRLGFDVIYVDVGGLSGTDGLLEAISLISSLMNALEPQCIVIKSKCMRKLASTLVPFWRTRL